MEYKTYGFNILYQSPSKRETDPERQIYREVFIPGRLGFEETGFNLLKKQH